MTKQTPKTLEQRIADALSDPQAASTDLLELIGETEQAVIEAERLAQSERRKALDPIASPDSAKAEQVVWAAELRRDRLRSFLSRLCQRYDEVEQAKRITRWEANHDAVKAKRDAVAKELVELYPNLSAQLFDLFRRARAIDEECSRVNADAPTSEHRRLLEVELTARKLESFSGYEPSIIEAVKLPDWPHSGRMAWPPPKIPLSVTVATR